MKNKVRMDYIDCKFCGKHRFARPSMIEKGECRKCEKSRLNLARKRERNKLEKAASLMSSEVMRGRYLSY